MQNYEQNLKHGKKVLLRLFSQGHCWGIPLSRNHNNGNFLEFDILNFACFSSPPIYSLFGDLWGKQPYFVLSLSSAKMLFGYAFGGTSSIHGCKPPDFHITSRTQITNSML